MVWPEKCHHTLNISWWWNEKNENKTGWRKKKPVSVLDLKDQVLHAYLLERKKMTKWYIKIFRRLLSATILNSMVICRANSQWKRIDHLKFRTDMVQAPLVQHGGGVQRKVRGRHSMDNTVPRLLERHFHRGFLQLRGSQYQQRGVLCVTRTTRGRRRCSGVLIVRPVCVLRAASRLTTWSWSLFHLQKL
jgi:hypothetical protein